MRGLVFALALLAIVTLAGEAVAGGCGRATVLVAPTTVYGGAFFQSSPVYAGALYGAPLSTSQVFIRSRPVRVFVGGASVSTRTVERRGLFGRRVIRTRTVVR